MAPLPSSVLIRSISPISLRKLILVVGAIDGDDNEISSPTLPTSHITYLGLHGTGAIYPLLLHPSTLAHFQLQYLGLSIDRMASKEVINFINASSSSLLHLELNGPGTAPDPSNGINFS
jgi:hypothetical protein